MDNLYKAAFTAIGTIIGAGVLGLPTAISKLDLSFITGRKFEITPKELLDRIENFNKKEREKASRYIY